MAELIVKGRHLIYVDESTFHMWQVPNKSWVRDDTVLNMPSSRGKSVTIIGAISDRLGIVHFKVFHGSNNAEHFAAFTRELLGKVRG